MSANLDQLARPVTTQAGDRHAVNVAARGQYAGVEIGMRIEPQNPQFLADGSTMSGDGADRTDAQTVIAAKQNR